VIGGPSRHFRWNDDLILAEIETLLRVRSCRHWILTSSRRTPAALEARLAELSQVEYVPFAANTSDWLPAQLAEAGEVWVSEDSVSMLYEALTSGAKVGILPVPRRARSNRVSRGIDALVAQGLVCAPGDWQLRSHQQMPLNEAGRCADWIADQWLNVN
jgi:mitochondrial fission protein ELM1